MKVFIIQCTNRMFDKISIKTDEKSYLRVSKISRAVFLHRVLYFVNRNTWLLLFRNRFLISVNVRPCSPSYRSAHAKVNEMSNTINIRWICPFTFYTRTFDSRDPAVLKIVTRQWICALLFLRAKCITNDHKTDADNTPLL